MSTAPVVRQRRVGQTLLALVQLLPWPIIVVLAGIFPDQFQSVLVLVLAIPVVIYMFLVFAPAIGSLLWFGAARLVVDDDGIFFGTDKTRRTPSTAPQLAYRAPWSAISDPQLAHGWGRSKQMSKWARGRYLLPQASTFYGYFPCRWRRDHLVFDVDLTQVDLPQTSAPRGNPGSGKSVDLQPSTRWSLPVRHADAVRRAFDARAMALIDTVDVEQVRPALSPEQLQKNVDVVRHYIDEHGGPLP